MALLSLIIAAVITLGLTFAANLVAASGNRPARRLFDLFLALINAPLLLGGVALLFLPAAGLAALTEGEGPVLNLQTAAAVLVGTGLWAVLASVAPVRRLLARLLPIVPESPVHAVALIFAGYLVGSTLFALTQGGVMALADTAAAATVFDVVLQQMFFVALAYAGAGIFIRRNNQQLNERLGLVRLSWPQLRAAAAWVGVLIIFQWVVGLVWAFLDPVQAEVFGGISEALFGNFDTVWEWFVLAISAALGEELLFRGALQPAIGNVFTALLFAIAHVQFGLTPVTVAFFFIALALGYIRRRYGTSTTIVVHFSYNFVLGLLSLAAVYLERFVD